MESANIHQLQQDQLVGSPSPSSSSSLPIPSSCYGLASSTSTHAWIPTPNVTLNASNNFNQSNGFILNPSSPMIQESAGLHWINNQSTHDHFAKIKEEFSDSFPKFTEILNCSPSSNIEASDFTTTSYLKNHEPKNLNDLRDKLFLKTISSGFSINGNNDQFSVGDFYSSSGSTAMPSRGNFSQIYPSINISNLNQSSSLPTSSSFDMNLQALDLLTSARFRGDFSQPSHDNLGFYQESPFGFDHLQQSSRRPSCSSSNKISHFTNSSEITEATKRPSGLLQQKAIQSASKKTRLESRASCPPFKVRKEKLGDRIAALQQMVAPFGKTDTASVLMEAIGYIKFLQSQIETLSVPYMKSYRNKSSRTIQGGSMAETGDEEPKRDLRSRGLCLVPLSCMSCITNDAAGGGGVWPPPPNFGGET